LVSGNCKNKMTLKSVKEDLQVRTLRAVSGVLGKLEYFTSLRQEDGSYSHWGLSRVYGEEAAQRALAEAHKNNVSQILRTPLRKLLQDAKESGGQNAEEQARFFQQLEDREAESVPKDPSAGSPRHLSSVLRALSALVKTRE
jgi:hypothetical protein